MTLHVSAVQLAFSIFSSPQKFYDYVYPAVEYAARNGAELIVLPNYTGWMLLGVGVRPDQTGLSLGEIARAGKYATVADMLCAVAPVMRDFYLNLFATLARRVGAYLAPGTVVEFQGGRLFNTAFLITPDGHVVGAQRQCHRSPREIGWGFAQGEELSVWDIGIARVGMVVGADAAYPEVARILALQNANLLIHSAAYPTWNDEYFLMDLWRDAQANQVFGIQACAVGEYKGKSAVYAPVEMTRAHNGILAQASSADAEEIVIAALDFDLLQKTVGAYSVFDSFNA
ncbi:partial N-carbamoyl-D-amino acid hydrolase, partial [Anaerolineae bacterium]